jgi:microcystin-dependent protein
MADIIPGTVTTYAGTEDSLTQLELNGWLLCDGKLYDRIDVKYAKLFGAIGTSWGGDGGNKFAVPDLRGMFLRGVSGNSGNDPDTDKRDRSRPDLHSSGNGGNAVGSKQGFDIQAHTHTLVNNSQAFAFKASGMGIQSDEKQEVQFAKPDISINAFGGMETRPKNAYVYYIIKL